MRLAACLALLSPLSSPSVEQDARKRYINSVVGNASANRRLGMRERFIEAFSLPQMTDRIRHSRRSAAYLIVGGGDLFRLLVLFTRITRWVVRLASHYLLDEPPTPQELWESIK